MIVCKRLSCIGRTLDAMHSRNNDSYLIGISHHLLPIVACRKIFQSVHSSMTDSSHLVGHLICILFHDSSNSTHDLNCSNLRSLAAPVSMCY